MGEYEGKKRSKTSQQTYVEHVNDLAAGPDGEPVATILDCCPPVWTCGTEVL